MKVHVTFCSGYNGCYVILDDAEESLEDHPIVDEILEYTYSMFEDEEFCGSIKKVERFIEQKVREHFGNDVVFEFEHDSLSS